MFKLINQSNQNRQQRNGGSRANHVRTSNQSRNRCDQPIRPPNTGDNQINFPLWVDNNLNHNQFMGASTEDPYAVLIRFLQLCISVRLSGIISGQIKLFSYTNFYEILLNYFIVSKQEANDKHVQSM